MYLLETARSVNYEKTTEEMMEAMVAAGIRKIEISFCNPPVDFSEEEMKAQVKRWMNIRETYGVEILSLHLPFGPTWELCTCDEGIREHAMEQYLKLIAILKVIGPKRFVLHPGYPRVPVEEREQRIANFRKNVVILAETVKPARIAVENMPQDCLGNTAEELIRLVDGLDNIGICCDTNHWYQELTHEALAKLADRVETVHINDYDGKVETHWLAGQGVVDWMKVIGLLEQHHYAGPFLYECGPVYSSAEVAAATKRLFDEYNGQK